MSAPTEPEVKAYLEATGGTPSQAELSNALKAERAAQAAICRVPADDAVWPADLTEALKRRVARNLAMKNIPLGVQSAMSEAAVSTIRVGSDPEIRRLEAPHRKHTIG